MCDNHAVFTGQRIVSTLLASYRAVGLDCQVRDVDQFEFERERMRRHSERGGSVIPEFSFHSRFIYTYQFRLSS